ncbi:MAG TPA: hypothetical protein VIX86_21185 [Streptosporangiaceae bacterium]
MPQRRWQVPSAVLLALAGVWLAAPAAQASVGVGIQAAPVRLAGVAHAGQSYQLPAVSVINTGSQPESITVRVQRILTGPGRAVPPAWVQIPGQGVRLAPHAEASIPLSLSVPGGAKPGGYVTELVAYGSASVQAGGASLGAAAATKLEFRVVADPGGLFWFIPGWVSWAALWLFLLALLAAAVTVAWKSGLRLRVTHDTPDRRATDPRWSRHA